MNIERPTTYGPTALATPANAVTVARIVATPFLFAAILSQGKSYGILTGWIVLAGTDWVDGWIARRQGRTRSGAFLDPLADKFLVLGAMFALFAAHEMPLVPMLLITARELGISAYRSYVGRRGVSVPARLLAKIKTWVQDVAIGFAVVPGLGHGGHVAFEWILWAAVVLTLWTAAQYMFEASEVMKQAGD